MIRVHQGGRVIEIEAGSGENLWRALSRAGVAVSAPCGGRAFCGKCKARVAFTGTPPEFGPEERDHLSPSERERGVRLACTIAAQDAEVWIDQEGAQVLTEGASVAGSDPSAHRRTVTVEAPTLELPRDDLSRLEDALGAPVRASAAALRTLPGAMRAGGPFAVTLFEDEDGLHLLDAGRGGALYGVAVDIGTTTLAAFLMNLATGEQIDVLSRLNPQAAYGADVVSRCDAASAPEGLEALRGAVCGALEELLAEFVLRNGLHARDIAHVVLVGNTVMTHLAAGVSPAALAVIPFVPAFTRGVTLTAREFGLPLDHAWVSLLPSVAGYVGADTVAAALSASLQEGAERWADTALLIDIGTNGEMVLRVGERLLCCSTAAGPAFEGAHIKHGMGGVAGAISKVRVEEGKLVCETIAGASPRGICGSGLLDAVAALLALGILDETGSLDPDEAPDGIEMTEDDGKPAVVLAHGEDGPILLTARDIREVQLAKAAIAAGIESLLGQAGIAAGDVGQVQLAGGFGSYLDVASACAIGLLPKELQSVTRGIGNAAGSGARAALLSRTALQKAGELRGRMEYIELSVLPEFQDLFVEHMMFE